MNIATWNNAKNGSFKPKVKIFKQMRRGTFVLGYRRLSNCKHLYYFSGVINGGRYGKEAIACGIFSPI